VSANVYFVGKPGGPWTMVDAATPGDAAAIRAAAEERFGDVPPRAILLTHGHYDHSGSARELAAAWDVPIYVHPLELPFVTGRARYAPFDPTVGGLVGRLSPVFPRGPFDLGPHVAAFPDGVDVLPGWKIEHLPGHAPGHVVFYRPPDRALLAGDVVSTMDLASVVDLLLYRQVLTAAPQFVTYDWELECEALRKLAALRPVTLAAGHGRPMLGAGVPDRLGAFVRDFKPPTAGRYAARPAVVAPDGSVTAPPAPFDPVRVAAAAAVIGAIALAAIRRRRP
jgi:glyoxylase-like metal-dependent hydrolase (beta-lactamase superfamily II)